MECAFIQSAVYTGGHGHTGTPQKSDMDTRQVLCLKGVTFFQIILLGINSSVFGDVQQSLFLC